MKAAVFLILSLFSCNALAEIHLTEFQKIKIKNGWTCCYSDEVLEQVQTPLYLDEKDIILDFDVSQRVDPASNYHWAAFWLFQALDVYTTSKAMQWDCVKEVNPLLPERPTAGRIIVHKSLFLWPLVEMDLLTPLTDRELWPATAITAGVVLSNFRVIDRAKQNCNKLR